MLRRAPKPDRKALLFVFITVLLSMIGVGIVIPVMPSLIADLTGLGLSDASRINGFLLTSYALMQLIMSPILGALSDRFGRRPVLLVSVLIYGCDLVLMALAPSLAWLFVGRLMSGATAATFATANAFIADVSTEKDRSANFGLMGAAFGLGFIIGPVLGGWLGEVHVRLPFVVAAAVAFANLIFGWLVLPETVTDATRRPFDWKRANPVGGLIAVSRHPTVLGVLFAFFLMQFSHSAFPAVWAFFTQEKFGWGEGATGTSLAFVGVTAALVQGGLVRKVMPKLGEVRAVLIGLSCSMVAIMGYALGTPSGAWIYFWIMIGSIGGFVMPGMQAIMSRSTPPNAQGELQGAIASLMSLTMATSPLVMTQVFAFFTADDAPVYFPGAPFILGAMMMALSVIPFWLTMRGVAARAAAATSSAQH